MNRDIFDAVLTAVLNNRPLSWAITDTGVGLPEFHHWVATQRNPLAFTAALYRASADSRRSLAHGVARDLGRRIDDGLITTAALASVEGEQIKRLNKQADSFEAQADKALAALIPPARTTLFSAALAAHQGMRG